MKFLSLVLENYGSYFGRHEFGLSGLGLVLVLGNNLDEPRMSSNGSGKSTPWEAFDWCLWGVIPKGDHVDSIINEEAGKNCLAGVRIEDDLGRLVQVERFRKWKDAPDGKETGLRLTVDGVLETSLDVAETQRKLEVILGLDREVFHAAILFGQNDNWRFADGTDSERIDILTRVLQLGEIDDWLGKTKELLAQAAADHDQYDRALAEQGASLSSLQGMDFQKQIFEWDAGQRNQLALLDRRLAEWAANFQTLWARMGDEAMLKERWRILEANAPLTPARLNDRAEAEMEAGARASILTENNRWEVVTQRILLIRSQWGGACPECGQAVSKEHVEQEVARLTAEADLRQRNQEIAALEARRFADRREVLRQDFEAQMLIYRQAVDKHAADKAVVQQLMWESQQYQRQAREANAAVESLTRDRQLVEAQVNPFVAKRAEVQKSIEALQIKILELAGRINGVNGRLKLLEFWVEAFGAKGLKSYILDTRLQEMTDAVNERLKLLTGGTLWVRFETQVMGRSTGRLANKLNIRVFQYGRDGRIVERNYKSLSGGQKARVSVGVDFGLARLLAARARQRYDLLILDEVFKHLDRAGREAVVEMLHHLRVEKSSLIVVDHDAEFGAAFENVIQVDLKDRKSTIREVYGATTEEQKRTLQRSGASIGPPVSTGAQAAGSPTAIS